MSNFRDILESRQQQLATGSNFVRPTGKCTAVQLAAVDRTLGEIADLTEAKFKRWYAQQVIRLGCDRVLGLASDARQGRDPKKLFSYLLKRTT